ncbi:MAG: cation diffusion facilitator family transporter [Pirellulales bacterium]
MKLSPAFEFPPEQLRALRKARRLEWLTIVYLLSVVVVMYFVLGSSQAMKTAWLEDILSLLPPVVFLVASRVAIRPPNQRFPYGYHRAVSIAFLVAAVTLLSMGGWLLIDAVIKLIKAEHPTIGGVHLFGQTIWLGWLMLPALVWSGVPAVLLGRAKLPLASMIHDKVLYADAEMNKADWLTALSAFVGVLGIGLGYWWADAVAAAVISLAIIHDGYTNLREVVTNLMDEVPKTVERTEPDRLPRRVEDRLKQFPWILDAQVRMREEGHVYFGEAFVVVDKLSDLPARLYEATEACAGLDWRVHDLVLVVVPALERESGADAV